MYEEILTKSSLKFVTNQQTLEELHDGLSSKCLIVRQQCAAALYEKTGRPKPKRKPTKFRFEWIQDFLDYQEFQRRQQTAKI